MKILSVSLPESIHDCLSGKTYDHLSLIRGRVLHDMSLVYISSTGDHGGQSLITWTIAGRLLEKGLNPGFFKPFGNGIIRIKGVRTDPDALLFREVLNIPDPLESICPFTVPEAITGKHSPKDIIETIKRSVDHLHEGRDLLLIMGSEHIFFDDAPYPIPDISIISELNADLVLVHRYQKMSSTLYSILSVHSLINKNVKGIIINRVPHDKTEEVERIIIPSLNEKGIFNVSFIPEDPGLSFRRLGEICNILGARVIFGEECLNNVVERMTVGTTGIRGDLLILKRVYNKIILLGPSNDFGIAGIIMTGGREPGRQILETVKRSNIPLITTRENSLAALERLENTTLSLSPSDKDKAVHCAGIMDRSDSLNKLVDSLIHNR